MARLFSAKPKNAEEAAQFQSYFKKHGRYTAGVETRYDSSAITGDNQYQSLATGLKVGMRFHSAPVMRLGDGKPVELGHVVKADGRWRLFIFSNLSRLNDLCEFLISDRSSPLLNYTPDGLDIDAFLHCNSCVA